MFQTLFYRNIRLLLLSIVAISVIGIATLQSLPRMEDPVLRGRWGLVTMQYPGASAEQVEALVTETIEKELYELEEVKNLYANIQSGFLSISIQLKPTVSDVENSWARVRDKLNDAASVLPPEVTNPEFDSLGTELFALTIALLPDDSEGQEPVDLATLSRYARALDDRMQSLAGVERVELFGMPQEEIVVEADPATLSTLRVKPEDLAAAIQASDARLPVGHIRGNRYDFLVKFDNLESLSGVEQIPILAGESGQFLRLGDIATVKKGIASPPREVALISGAEASVVGVQVQVEERVDVWIEQAREILNEFQQELPAGICLQITFDQSKFVKKRLEGLFNNLILGAICVFGVTTVMMGWRSGLAVGLTLPLTVFVVFAGMHYLRIPLHQMSVTGLVLSLGLLIDNAIVVVDSVQEYLHRGATPKCAITSSLQQLAVPLLASTLTTVLAFAPILLVPGDVGEFLKPISLSVILALTASFVLSLIVVPALAVRIQQWGQRSQHQTMTTMSWWTSGFTSAPLTRLYIHLLDWFLSRPVLGIGLALVLPIAGFIAAPTLAEQLFPPAERNQFHLELELPSNAAIEQTQRVALKIRSLILQHSEVKDVHWFLGRNAPKFYYNVDEWRREQPNYAHGIVDIENARDSRQIIRILQTELDQLITEGRVIVRQLEQGNFSFAPVELRLSGPDLVTLETLGEQIRLALVQTDNVTHVRSYLGERVPQLALKADEEKLRLSGLDKLAIAKQLDTHLEGRLSGAVLEDTEELPIRIRLNGQQRGTVDQVSSLDLVSLPSPNSKGRVPISSIGELVLTSEFSTITRRNGQRVNTLQGFINAGTLPAHVQDAFERQLQVNGFELPPGYTLEVGGQPEQRDEAIGLLMAPTATSVMVIAVTLVISFNSFRLGGIIAIVAVCSLGLSCISLWIFNYPLGMMSILGTMGLMGVAINDSIVVLAAIKSNSQASEGNRRCIRNVVVGETRHVLTTTLTTLAGFIPLYLEGGEFWPPMVVTITGGIGGATVLALYFVPCIYMLTLPKR